MRYPRNAQPETAQTAMLTQADPSRYSSQGIAFMLIAVALLSTMDALVKWLVMDGVHALQILSLRSLAIAPLMVVIHAVRGNLRELMPVSRRAHTLRALIGFSAPLCFFIGLGHVPLSNAVLVFFSSIFFITMLSIAFLGERVGLHRWLSIIVGYVGVFIVVLPSLQGGLVDESLGYLLVLLASAAYAILFASGRYLSATESVASLVFSFNAGVGVCSLVLLPWFWEPLNTLDVAMIAVVAVLALGGHHYITRAFSVSEASLIAPLDYTGLLWALVFDALIWHHYPGITTGLGALVIIGSGLYVIHREQLHSAR